MRSLSSVLFSYRSDISVWELQLELLWQSLGWDQSINQYPVRSNTVLSSIWHTSSNFYENEMFVIVVRQHSHGRLPFRRALAIRSSLLFDFVLGIVWDSSYRFTSRWMSFHVIKIPMDDFSVIIAIGCVPSPYVRCHRCACLVVVRMIPTCIKRGIELFFVDQNHHYCLPSLCFQRFDASCATSIRNRISFIRSLLLSRVPWCEKIMQNTLNHCTFSFLK